VSKFEGLSKADMALIAEWFESDTYRTFTKVVALRRDALASQLLTTYNDKQIPNIQGQAEGVKNLHEFFKSVNKEFRKDRD
jgi:hypothetical protein